MIWLIHDWLEFGVRIALCSVVAIRLFVWSDKEVVDATDERQCCLWDTRVVYIGIDYSFLVPCNSL
jgi:hypothetical protein